MTTGLRWRIMTLQAVLVLVLGFCAGFLFYESNFITSTIHDQLAAQKIYFPNTGDAAFKALPASDQTAMATYAGQQLTTGTQAETYADHYIAVHLQKVAGGKTYAQVSQEAQADPKNATLAAQKATLFQGETLRGILLNAYGWAQFGQYMLLAAVGAAVATLIVLGTFLFELVAALRREPVSLAQRTLPKAAPASH
jgi:hypothetical protein